MDRPIPLIRANAVRPLLGHLERVQAPRSRAFAEVSAAVHNDTGLLPFAYGGQLYENAARELGVETLGLEVGRKTEIEEIGEFGQLLRRCLTVGEMLVTAVRYGSRFNTGQRYELERRGELVSFSRAFTPALRRGRQHVVDFAQMLFLNTVREAAGPDWRPSEIHFEGDPPRHAEELAAMARKSAHFGSPRTCFVFPRRVLALPLRPAAGAGPSPRAAQRSASPALPAVDFVSSARQAVDSLLRVGMADVAEAAEVAGTSVRSLQRRLTSQGLSFSRLIDESRFRAACRLLHDPSVKIVDVSAELGYTDSANFTRAFRRWTGLAPQEFRRSTPAFPLLAP